MCNGFIWVIIAWLVFGNGNDGCGRGGEAANGCGCHAVGNYTRNGCGCNRAASTCSEAVEPDCVRVVRNNGCGC